MKVFNNNVNKKENLYHIKCDGHTITSTPLTMRAIVNLYGSVVKLEAQGFRLVKGN